MHIAILGWGSLIWNPCDLSIDGEWLLGGPTLPIEFARISSDERLTLVIDEVNGTDVPTRYVRSGCDNLSDAIGNLRRREGNPLKERIGYVNVASGAERAWSRQQHPTACDRIKAWAQIHKWDAVVWTALTSNFPERLGEPYSAQAALRYFNGLEAEAKARAVAYLSNAPPEVDTPFRRLALVAAGPQ
jgi:hypothetical protein